MQQQISPLDVKFAPGVLEELETTCTPEEVQTFVDYITKLAISGNIPSDSAIVDMDALELEDPELFEAITKSLEAVADMETSKPFNLQ